MLTYRWDYKEHVQESEPKIHQSLRAMPYGHFIHF